MVVGGDKVVDFSGVVCPSVVSEAVVAVVGSKVVVGDDGVLVRTVVVVGRGEVVVGSVCVVEVEGVGLAVIVVVEIGVVVGVSVSLVVVDGTELVVV